MKSNTIGTVLGLVLTALGLCLTIGTKTLFTACPDPMENGMWMACHWAEQGVFASGIAMSVMGLLALLMPQPKVKAGLSLALVPAAAVTALIPGVFIDLCKMNTMHCHTMLRPAVIVICVLMALCAAVNAFIQLRKD